MRFWLFRAIAPLGATLTAFVALASCSHSADEGSDSPVVERPVAGEAAGGVCGDSGQPPCPLQGWMKANMTPAMNAADVDRLKRAFLRTVDLGPPQYATWRTIALAGADAASRSDLEGARRACKQCHDEHRAHYRAELRARRLP